MSTFTKIQFGDGLLVTDLGAGTIRVDGSGGVGPEGPAGPPGPPGASNAAYTGEWVWTTKTADAATSGQVGINAATWAAATQLNLNEQKGDNADTTAFLARVEVGDSFYVQQKTDSTRWAKYTITGAGVDHGTWWSWPVTFAEGAGLVPNGNAPTVVSVLVQGPVAEADKNYVHVQSVLSATWVVAHNLGKYASVEVVDSGGSVIIPNVQYDSLDQVTLTFGAPTSGKAYVN